MSTYPEMIENIKTKALTGYNQYRKDSSFQPIEKWEELSGTLQGYWCLAAAVFIFQQRFPTRKTNPEEWRNEFTAIP
ncbi:MAG: hypothetical protein OMM_07251 [Candidatus Magnetoglobus multicellularis str. Araruama]|uniref:Uncharacterized protein n=1 Tax=Candidatus Magnetoglobus multicellularis str. Araruama TaxID=890399 RepID=A0A1V1PDH3_9BACT|nr:MAG: hypothetical protein OMM_07251 [Candidatus Magnetoglobus multicellularis str. Araruama]